MPKRQQIMGKAETEKHWKGMLEARQILRTYCRHNRLVRSEFILGMIRHLPHEWADNQHLIGPIAVGKCGFCTREFYLNTGKQLYCDEQCAASARLVRDPNANNPAKRASSVRAQAIAELEKLKLQYEENPAG